VVSGEHTDPRPDASAPDRDEPFVHPAVFYRGAEDYLSQTVPFVLDGLAAGQPVAVAVPPGNLHAIRREVTGDDSVTWLDMTEAGRNPGRIIPTVLRAFADQHPDRHVRIIGEPIWPSRTATEYPACVQHEALINLAFTGRDVTILCPYDADGLSETTLADAKATHPLLVDRDRSWSSDTYAPDRIVDAYNRPLPELAGTQVRILDAGEPHRARQAAVGLATDAGLSADGIDAIAMVVTELVTNSIEHGGGSPRLQAWITDTEIVYEVFDTGRLTDPLAGRRPVPSGSFRGRGLLLVNTFSDLVRTHTSPQGTTIRTHFRRT